MIDCKLDLRQAESGLNMELKSGLNVGLNWTKIEVS